jgi:hypothetical protein
MTFDAFRQAQLMNAYTGAKTAVVPENPIDSIDDLKKLAGISTSYGEETSEYATNLGQIQRERNIRPGSDEWFRLWFSKPFLTGEQPYDKR